MQIVTLNPNEFDMYAITHKYRNYYQTSAYGKTMQDNGFNIHYIGIKEDNKLIGASLLIYKQIFMNQKIAYAPRGILFDYNDPEKLKELTEKLKEVLGKQGFIILRIDPYIPATIRDDKGTIINVNNEVNQIMVNLKAAGFTYKGQNKFFENELPRYEGVCLLNKSSKELFSSFAKRTRHKIRRASGCGITVFKDNEKKVNILYEMCKEKTGLSEKYIKDFVYNFKTSNIYYALLNTDSFVIEAKKRYEKELDRNNELANKIQDRSLNNNLKQKILNTKMESDNLVNIYKNDLVLATNLLKEKPNGIIIASALTIEYNNAVYIILDGYDKRYAHLNASYILKWFMIDDAKDRNLKYINMNAIVGEFKKPNPYKNLNEMKLGFNLVPTEYIGEFELVLNNFNYMMYKGLSKDKNYKLQKDITNQ